MRRRVLRQLNVSGWTKIWVFLSSGHRDAFGAHEKQKKLTALFPLPATDSAHPPKLDKDIPKSVFTYDKLLSKLQQFNMDALGLLLHVLHCVMKGKFMAKLIVPLETAVKLSFSLLW